MGVLLVSWIFFSFICAIICGVKGRSPAEGMLCGLLGIFGIIVACCLARKDGEKA